MSSVRNDQLATPKRFIAVVGIVDFVNWMFLNLHQDKMTLSRSNNERRNYDNRPMRG